jgi:hypothetical protein
VSTPFERLGRLRKIAATSIVRITKIGYRESVAHLSIVLAESYALNELSEDQKRQVEKHVASCQRCADLVGEQLVWVAQMRSPFKRAVEKMIEEGRKKRTGKD